MGRRVLPMLQWLIHKAVKLNTLVMERLLNTLDDIEQCWLRVVLFVKRL